MADPAAGEPLDRTNVLDAIAESLGMTLAGAKLVRVEAGGDGFTTGHEVALTASDGSEQRHTIFIDSRTSRRERPGALTLRDESGAELAAWIYPADPELPTLAAAVYPDAAATLLRRLGVDAAGLRLEMLAYRPGKRAVVRMETDQATLFLKVVRPAVAESLQARHEAWRAAGIPVPRVLAWAPDGLVALERLPGIEAIGAVGAIDGDDTFFDSLDDLMAQVQSLPSERAARASLLSRLDWYERRTISLAPPESARTLALCAAIGALADENQPTLEPVTIHGDLHLAQVFVDPQKVGSIVGLLDIDTAGLGDPADDAAALWAHLVVTARRHDERGQADAAASARSVATRLRDHWVRHGDPGFALRTRAIAATHLLGHALSGAVSATVALDEAEDLMNEKALMHTSRPSHAAPAL